MGWDWDTMDAIIFSSWLKTDCRVCIGEEYLDIFKKYFSDCDIYVGINPKTVPLWKEKLEAAKKDLSIIYSDVPSDLYTGSDASGFQRALLLMKENNKEYDTVYFGHTKGANRNDSIGMNHRRMLLDCFWLKRKEISQKLHRDKKYGSYGPIMSLSTTPGHSDKLDKYFDFPFKSLNILYIYTFYAIRGDIVLNFIKNCSENFFSENLCDRYFFESTFMNIATKMGYEPLYGSLTSHPPSNTVTKERVENIIKQWKKENRIS